MGLLQPDQSACKSPDIGEPFLAHPALAKLAEVRAVSHPVEKLETHEIIKCLFLATLPCMWDLSSTTKDLSWHPL